MCLDMAVCQPAQQGIPLRPLFKRLILTNIHQILASNHYFFTSFTSQVKKEYQKNYVLATSFSMRWHIFRIEFVCLKVVLGNIVK